MREYSRKISLNKNSRGVYSIDPTLGCSSGMKNNTNGCYSDCYAYRIAKIYGYDFSKTVKRYFDNDAHLERIKKQISKADLPFIRMGTMGDPSEDWHHTIDICRKIRHEKQLKLFNLEKKEIVIITKHWQIMPDEYLFELRDLEICINSSISVLDDDDLFNRGIAQYERLKPFCKSVLRVVTCDFSEENELGKKLKAKQDFLFKNYDFIDTVFRPSKNNKLVVDGVINTKSRRFISNKQLVSKAKKGTYLGKCQNCKEMCGVTTNFN